MNNYSKQTMGYLQENFTEIELKNILRKVKKAIMKPNLKEIMSDIYGKETYFNEESDKFFEKYSGKKTNVYMWCGDWWICEDDNFVIFEECFDLIQ